MQRPDFIKDIEAAFRVSPVVALLGPRQCGKTTLAQFFVNSQKGKKTDSIHRFDLEDDRDLARLDNPLLALEDLKGLIIIDEIQRAPDLFKTLRVLVDRTQRKVRYLILGSSSRELIHQSSETLAGRISYIQCTPFNLNEVGSTHMNKLWVRGGFPPSYLAKSDSDSSSWRREFVTTFLEKDIPNLGIQISSRMLRRFWNMVAHYHGQIFNASEIGHSLGISDHTAKKYLDILTDTFMIRQLTPWLENVKKRQIKSPKIFFRDSGLYHTLMNLNNRRDIMSHPKLGASWEGFALEEILRKHKLRDEEAFFWGVHNQAEIDLLLFQKGKKLGYEIKYTDKPKVTNSMKISIEQLALSKLKLIIPGSFESFSLDEKIEVESLR